MLLDTPRIVILSGLVTGGVLCAVLGMRAKAKRDASTRALAAGLPCPDCARRTLKWHGTHWRIRILYANGREEEKAGPLFHCATCEGEFSFTERGEFQSHDDLSPATRTDRSRQQVDRSVQMPRSEDGPIRFAVLTPEEAEGMEVEWDASLALTDGIRAALPLPTGEDKSQRGRLRLAFTTGARDRVMTFQPGAVVLVDDFGLVLIQYNP